MKSLQELLEKKYSCTCCSECCGAWNLPVEEAIVSFLKQQDLIKSIIEKETMDFTIKDGKYYLPQKDLRCLFLNHNNNLCILHEHYGFDHKPIECIKYPLTFLEDVDNNVYIETSFYCSGVLDNVGEDLSTYAQTNFTKSCKKQVIPEKVLLSSEVTLEFEKAEDIKLKIVENIYTNLIALPINDWWEVLLRHTRIFNQLENRISLNYEYDLQELLDKITALTTKDKDHFRQNILNAYIIIKQKNVPDTLSIFFRKGSLFDILLDSKVNVSKINSVTIDESESTRELFLRFLLDVFLRKTLLADNYSIQGIYLLSISAYTLVLWYARLNAILRNDSVAAFEDIQKAIRLTERFYTAHNTSFLPLYKEQLSHIVLKNLCVI